MTPSGIWQDIGAGENVLTKLLRLVFLLAAGAAFCFLAFLPLTWPQQAVLGLLTLLIAIFLARGSDSYLVTLMLMMMSMFCTFRYGYWRVRAGDPLLSGSRQPLGRNRCLLHPLPAAWQRPMRS